MQQMMKRVAWVFKTDDGWDRLILRVAAGAVMLPHGAQKALGMFGGPGFSGAMAFLTSKMGLPWIVALTVILAEFLGSLALIAGAFTRISALALAAVMIGAVVTVHYKFGFFMNWYGRSGGEGFEYHLLVIGMCLALTIGGGGRASLDKMIAKKLGA